MTLPRNIQRAVFAVAATGQHDDEFWWQNAPDEAAQYLPSDYGFKSSFREVRVRIDGAVAGLAWPFPVVFTGGVAPGLHRPMAGPQAFDLLEQEIDITPWLGVLCDGKPHTLSIEVVGQSDKTGVNDFWYVSGKVFLWLAAPGSITSGPAPAVALPASNFQPNVQQSKDNVTTWTQTVSRKIEVAGIIRRNGKFTPVTWSQTFEMVNKGYVDNAYQRCDAKYSGRDLSTINGDKVYSFSYNNPIYLDYNTTIIDSTYVSNTVVNMVQTMDRTVMDQSVFSNGLEAFLAQVPGLTGSDLKTTKRSHVFQYQLKNGTSGYDTTADQTWTLSGVKGGHPLLYKRELGQKNGLYSGDRTHVYGGSRMPLIGQGASSEEGSANGEQRGPNAAAAASKDDFAYRPFHRFVKQTKTD